MKSGHPSKVINRYLSAWETRAATDSHLHDMVPIVILDAIDHSTIEFANKSVPLIFEDMLERFLDHLHNISS